MQEEIEKLESISKILKEKNNLDHNEKEILQKNLLDETKLSQLISKNKAEIIVVNENLDLLRVNKEHFWRELIQIYEDLENRKDKDMFDREEFYLGYADYLKNGGDFEVIDGDNNKINHNSLQKLFNNIHKPEEKSSLFVISIIGPQSTGKSTLLNFLFNSNFQMSAGRCTQGLYASLFKTNYENVKECLVLDSEGLLSIERNDETFDKKLTIFAMGLSHVMIINVMGEINESMKKIISLSMYAAQQLKVGTNKRPIIFFVLRNMIDDDKNKQREMIDKLEKEFEEVAKCSNVKLSQILDYRHSDSFELMYSAFKKDDFYQNDEKLFSFCIVTDGFRSQCENLRKKIFAEAFGNKEVKTYQNLHYFLDESKNIWESISTYKDILYFKDIKEVHNREKMSKNFSELMKKHIENLDDANSLNCKLRKLINDWKEKKFLDILNKVNMECRTKKNDIIIEFSNTFEGNDAKDLIEKYKEQFRNCVDGYEEQFKYEIKMNSSFDKAESYLKNINERLDEYMNPKIIEFEKNGEKDKTKLIQDFASDLEKNFEDKAKELFKSLKSSKKNDDEVFEQIIDMMYSVEKSQGRNYVFLDVSAISDCKKNREKILCEKFFFDQILDDKNSKEIILRMKNFLHINQETYNSYYNTYLAEQQKPSDKIGGKVSKKHPMNPNKTSIWNFIKDFLNPFKKSEKNNSNKKINEESKEKCPTNTPISNEEKISNIHKKIENKKSKNSLFIYKLISEEIKTLAKEFMSSKILLDTNGIRLLFDKIQKVFEETKMTIKDINFQFVEVPMKNQIVQHFIKVLMNKAKKEEDENISKYYNKFLEKKTSFVEVFKTRLSATHGDKEKAKDVKERIMDILFQDTIINAEKEYLVKLENKSSYTPEDMSNFANDALEKGKKSEIIKWATTIISYSEDKFDQMFIQHSEEIKKNIQIDFSLKIEKNMLLIIDSLKKCLRMFENIKIIQLEHENICKDDEKKINELYFELFIKFLLNDKERIKEIMNIFSGFKFLDIKDKEIEIKENIQNNTSDFSYFNNKDRLLNLFKGQENHISNPAVFLKSLLEGEQNKITNFPIDYTTVEMERHVKSIRNKNISRALGCKATCPYCGIKCTEALDHRKEHMASK